MPHASKLRRLLGVCGGLVALTNVAGAPRKNVPDPRIEQVERVDAFFDSYGCSEPNHAAEYVEAADRYDFDYRVLPAISLLESTCGDHQRLNNFWGWNSANTGFRSVSHGIEYVTRQLAKGEPYRRFTTLDRKLFAYNPRTAYVRKVKRLMRQIDDEASSPKPAPPDKSAASRDSSPASRSSQPASPER